jgi:hypothetical protein
MNKYLLRIPYSYQRYGMLTCNVYAETEDEAEDLAGEYDSHYSEDYDDNSDNDGDMDFDYSDTRVELEATDVTLPHEINNPPEILVPDYYLSEINLI